jgi:WD40 repeat protein
MTKFNKFHDQLLLTCSSDSTVNLESCVSVSSALKQDSDSIEEHGKLSNGLIASFEHEDSVYSTQWSPADPWIFASVSYDGRFMVNFVPITEKYKIIL